MSATSIAIARLVALLIVFWMPINARGADAGATPAETAPLAESIEPIECSVTHEDEMRSNKGTYMANLWASHIIPYDYVTNSNVAVNSYTGTNVLFSDSSPAVIFCSPRDFLPESLAPGDEIMVVGSSFNDTVVGNAYVVADTSNLRITLNAGHVLVSEIPQSNVTIYSTESVTASRQIYFENALLDWEAIANVDFVRHSSEANFVLVKNSNRNRSNVGNLNTGAQDLQIRNWSSNHTIVHELGHTLGMKHEQSRTDRETYVTINTLSIDPEFIGNFNIVWNSDAYPIGEHGVYDFGSIMHYWRAYFSIDGQDTIIVNEPWNAEWQMKIGTATEPSKFDRLTMSFLYPEADWKFLYASAPTTTGVGTFHNPYQGFRYAESRTPAGGMLVILYPDVYDAVGVYSEAKLFSAPIGGVVLR